MNGPSEGGGIHARLFRLLIRCYPSGFRASYGDEMTRFFVDRVSRARQQGGVAAVMRLYARATLDVLTTAAAERRSLPRIDRSHDGGEPMVSLLHDVRHALRRLGRTPLFTIAAIAILGIGIGLNAAVFSLVDAMLFRPPPFTDPDRVVRVYQHSDGGDPGSTAYPAYLDMAEMRDVFAGVAATSPASATLETTDAPLGVAIEFATASYLPVLGLSPSRGRWFAPEHDIVGNEMAAVVSYRTWQAQMGGDTGVVGRTIRINKHSVTIIGVGPPSFNGEAGALHTDFWLSISSVAVDGAYRIQNLEQREDHWYQVMARLAPNVSVEQARTAMNVLAGRIAQLYPATDAARGISVFAAGEVRFHPDRDGGLFTTGTALMGVAALLLLLAGANLANLLLVRGLSRAPELAMRQALGASRGRVVRLLLAESMLLSAAGGAAGLALAIVAVKFIPALPTPLPAARLDVAVDHRVVIFGCIVALVTGLICGLFPALRVAGADVVASLRDEGHGRSSGRGISFVRGGLVALQVAVSVALIVGAGLLARSVANGRSADPGVDIDRVAVMATSIDELALQGEGARAVTREIVERISALPGVERAALTTRLPVQRAGTTTMIVDGYTPERGTGAVEFPFAIVSGEYFATMGIDFLAGRGFTPDDRTGSPPVAIVNETAARTYWGDPRRAVGGRIRSQGNNTAWREVIGVVGDVIVSDLRDPPTPMMYSPFEQRSATSFTVVARTAGDPAALAEPMRRALREVRPILRPTRQFTLEEHLRQGLTTTSAAAALLGAFSLLALALAGIGVYAVVSFTVGRRTREIGIRAALGAAQPRLIRMVIGQSLRVVAVGVAGGLIIAALATRTLRALLFGVTPLDGATFGGAALLLFATASLAAFLPARRAARCDPAEVLREQ